MCKLQTVRGQSEHPAAAGSSAVAQEAAQPDQRGQAVLGLHQQEKIINTTHYTSPHASKTYLNILLNLPRHYCSSLDFNVVISALLFSI